MKSISIVLMENTKRIPPYKNNTFSLGSIFLAVSSVFASVNVAHAQGFSGYYDPSNWSISTGDPITQFSVDSVNAPSSLAFNFSAPSDNNLEGEFAEYTIIAPSAGSVSFDWSSIIEIQAFFSLGGLAGFGFITNNQTQILSSATAPADQPPVIVDENGTASFNVDAGDTFGFSFDSSSLALFGATDGSIDAIVSNFSAPLPDPNPPTTTPEPTSVITLIGVGVLGVASKLKKKEL